MGRYIPASLVTGVLFVVLDMLLNANPLALRLHQAFAPIARRTLNVVPAILIDLAYGFIVAGIYLMLRSALPGSTTFAHAISFALLLWILRVVMTALSHWVMFDVPGLLVLYDLAAGAAEMFLIALACVLILGPAP